MSDIAGFFSQVFETREGFKADCPACGDHEKKFAWNTEKGVGCCFHSSCRWYVGHGGVTEYRIRAWFNTRGFEHVIPETIRQDEDAEVELPEEFNFVSELPKQDRENIYAYLERRDIPKRIVDTAKIGYCTSGKYWGYIIFPIFNDEGDVVYWQGRRFKDRELKFWNPKYSKKSDLVYCIGGTRKPNVIVLVESAINVLTLEILGHGRTLIMGILGKSLSDVQRDHVLRYEKWVQELVIALDGDARRDTVEIADRFKGIIPHIKIANIPNGEDINSLGRERAWQLVRHAEGYNQKRRIEFMTREV